MTQPGSNTAVVLLVFGVVLLASVAFSAADEESAYAVSAEFVATDLDSGSALVAAKSEHSGITLLGIVFREPQYDVSVVLTAAEECLAVLADQEVWPPDDAVCKGPIDVAGTVGGLGRAASGYTLVRVTIPITQVCYNSMELGTTWASAAKACAHKSG
jgi:hypothetical protein